MLALESLRQQLFNNGLFCPWCETNRFRGVGRSDEYDPKTCYLSRWLSEVYDKLKATKLGYKWKAPRCYQAHRREFVRGRKIVRHKEKEQPELEGVIDSACLWQN